MSNILSSFVIPEGLAVANESAFTAKVGEFSAVGAGGVHAVFDFDRTLTVRIPGSHDEVTTWHILKEHLPSEAQILYQKLFEKYRALELSGIMTQKDAVDWWSATLNLFVEHKIDLEGVEKDFLDRASIRPETLELFKFLADNNIPTVILSAGTLDVIDIWCRKYSIEPSLIISTALVVDDSHKIVGWQEDTLVHVLNKSEANHSELLDIRARRPKALVVGDSLDDAAMAAGDRDVIRIRILDPRDDETMNEREKSKTFETFDALIGTGSLRPLRELVECIVR